MRYYNNRRYTQGYRRSLNSSINENADCYIIELQGAYYVTTDWDTAEDFILDFLQNTINNGGKVSNAQLNNVLNHKDPDIDVTTANRLS